MNQKELKKENKELKKQVKDLYKLNHQNVLKMLKMSFMIDKIKEPSDIK
jgi:hypothetical protein